MKLAPTIALLSAVGCSIPLAAAEFEDGRVPIELVQEFLSGELSSGLPEGFPVPEMPADSGLSVIGSLDSGGVVRQVALLSSVAWEEARETLRAAYVESGWIDLSRRSPAGTDNVIGGSANALSLCHDDLGSLDFHWQGPLQASAGSRRIRAMHREHPAPLSGGLSCEQQRSLGGISGPGGYSSFLTRLMPVLRSPENAQSNSPFIGLSGGFSSFGGNGLDFHMDRDDVITVPGGSAAMLYEHFAPQLEEQGWRLDAGSLGAQSASSIWLRTVHTPSAPGLAARELALTAFLNVVEAGDERYRVLLRLVSQEENGPAGSPPLGIRGISVPELGIRGIPPGTP